MIKYITLIILIAIQFSTASFASRPDDVKLFKNWLSTPDRKPVTFTGLDLSGEVFRSIDPKNINLDLSGAEFKGCNFTKTRIYSALAKGRTVKGKPGEYYSTVFKDGCSFGEAQFNNFSFDHVLFEGCEFPSTLFYEGDMTNTYIKNSVTLEKAHFSLVNLNKDIFTGNNNMRNTRIEPISMNNCIFRNGTCENLMIIPIPESFSIDNLIFLAQEREVTTDTLSWINNSTNNRLVVGNKNLTSDIWNWILFYDVIKPVPMSNTTSLTQNIHSSMNDNI